MTRDKARAKCIEVMAIAYIKRWQNDGNRLDCFTAAFDALHGLARICPVEATDIMGNAGAWPSTSREIFDISKKDIQEVFDIMSAIGDLTNPPETKP